MAVYILDSSAVLRYVDHEAGSDRVVAIFKTCVVGQDRARISAVQWGEIVGNVRKKFGAQNQNRILDSLVPLDLEIVPATAERAARAAELRVDHGISYADAFAAELAMENSDRVLVTADYGFKVLSGVARIEFLPAK